MWLDVDFTQDKAGLLTVGYRQYDNTGGDAVARTTTGVVEVGNGVYGVDVTPDASAVGVQWDTGETIPIYAAENLTQNFIDSVAVQSTLDLLEGDHSETYRKLEVYKKGTSTKILDKDISGSLLSPGITIITSEP